MIQSTSDASTTWCSLDWFAERVLLADSAENGRMSRVGSRTGKKTSNALHAHWAIFANRVPWGQAMKLNGRPNLLQRVNVD